MIKVSINAITRFAALCMIGTLLTIGTAANASAYTKTYNQPMHGGKRLDWCVNWAQGCGKQAADAFCKAKGFDKTTAFSIDHNIGQSSPTRLIGTGAVCDQGFCDGFKKVTCQKTVQTANYYKPMWNGDRLDLCLNWGQGCGKPAADAFCQKKGFAKSNGFTIDHDIGAMTRTRLISTGAVCDMNFCDGFKKITCGN